jgi:hypothetical protein
MAAIYMWYVLDDVIVTTTLYPVESSDGVEFSVSLALGILRQIHNTNMSVQVLPLDGTLTTILLDTEANPTEFAVSTLPLDSLLTTILNERDADPTDFGVSTLPLDGVLTTQLVTIQAPPRGAEFSITLGSCNLTPV